MADHWSKASAKPHRWDHLWKKCERCGITMKQACESGQGCTVYQLRTLAEERYYRLKRRVFG